MPFIEYNESTGLIVKSKADILTELINICKTAYGDDFTVIEGTEMYTFLDGIATSLASAGSASKAVYDAFGFITATGNPLSMLCSLAGVSRRTDEPDNVLRARYFKQLYKASSATEQGLVAKLLEQSVERDNQQLYLVNDVKIVNNDTSDDRTIYLFNSSAPNTRTSLTVEAHSIWVCVRKYDAFFEVVSTDPSTNYIKYKNIQYIRKAFNSSNINYKLIADSNALTSQLDDTVLKYKSLGCGIKYNDAVSFYYAQDVIVDLTIALTFNANLPDAQKDAIKNQITINVEEYINTLPIGARIKRDAIFSAVYAVYSSLGYNQSEGQIFGTTGTVQLKYNNTVITIDLSYNEWFLGDDCAFSLGTVTFS